MTIPWPGGPNAQQSVNQPDPSTQVAQGLTAMSRQLQGLNQALSAQTQMIQRSLNASSRYQMPGGGGGGGGGGHGGGGGNNTPVMRQQFAVNAQAMGQSLSGPGMQQVTGVGAASSSANMQAYVAQRIGQWIAGVPLYQDPPAGGGGGGGGGGGAPGGPAAPVGPRAVRPQGGLTGMLFGPGRPGGTSNAAAAGAMVLQNLGAQVAASGGGPGTIVNGLKSIPGIGAAVDSVTGAANFYQKQREAGRMYQNVEGGSNLGSQTERLHAAAYEASMWGRMPSGATAQAFGAVTQMGYNQAAANEGGQLQNRQSALNFVYHNYTATGMDVNESTQVLQTASQSALVNLQQLSDALNKLSTSAGTAGTNAETARAQFTSYLSTAIGQGSGNGSTGVAQGLSGMQAMMGKQMSGVNFSGELSQTSQYLLSGMSGLSAPQIQQLQRTNPQAYNSLKASQNMQFLSEGGLMTGQMQSSLQKMISQAGGTAALKSNPDLTQQIASQFLNQWQVKGGINENLWAQEISSLTGVQMNANQAFDWIVSQSGGVNEASSNSSIVKNSGASVAASKTGGAPAGQYGLAQAKSGNLLGTVTGGLFGSKGKSWQQVLQGADKGAANSYLASESKTGQRNPVLEALIQNTSSADKVAVQTATGQRVMSVSDAMKYYPNELEAGNVEFYDSSGKQIGNTSDITKGLTNTGASTSGEQKQKAGSTLGQTLKAFQAANPQSSGKTSVSVDLSTEAKKLLKLLPSTSDAAAASSTVPVNTYTSQASR